MSCLNLNLGHDCDTVGWVIERTFSVPKNPKDSFLGNIHSAIRTHGRFAGTPVSQYDHRLMGHFMYSAAYYRT